jgi:hypothetical protein
MVPTSMALSLGTGRTAALPVARRMIWVPAAAPHTTYSPSAEIDSAPVPVHGSAVGVAPASAVAQLHAPATWNASTRPAGSLRSAPSSPATSSSLVGAVLPRASMLHSPPSCAYTTRTPASSSALVALGLLGAAAGLAGDSARARPVSASASAPIAASPAALTRAPASPPRRGGWAWR